MDRGAWRAIIDSFTESDTTEHAHIRDVFEISIYTMVMSQVAMIVHEQLIAFRGYFSFCVYVPSKIIKTNNKILDLLYLNSY